MNHPHAVGTPIFAAFAHQIAAPIGMQDFDQARCRYVGGPDSIYPAYVFYASARDLARFGLLSGQSGIDTAGAKKRPQAIGPASLAVHAIVRRPAPSARSAPSRGA